MTTEHKMEQHSKASESIRAAITTELNSGDHIPTYETLAAAACEALAQQLVPEQHEPPCGEDEPWPPAYQHMSDSKWEQRQQTRSDILAIAADLRGEVRHG